MVEMLNQLVYIARMAKKISYSFSDIGEEKDGSGWYIKVIPDGLRLEENVRFKTEVEAKAWLVTESKAWLKKFIADRNRPSDPNQLAKMMVDIASSDSPIKPDQKAKAK